MSEMVRVFEVLGWEVMVGVLPTWVYYVGVEVGYYASVLRFSLGFWKKEFIIQVGRGERE